MLMQAILRPWTSPSLTVVTSTIISFGTVSFVKNHVVDITPINGTSMSPSLSPKVHETGERHYVIWNLWDTTEPIKTGDVVLFYSPVHADYPAVKRVVATGGDRVYLDPKRRPGYGKLSNELQPEELVALERWNTYGGSLIVPYGALWLEGDNWRKSRDSNDYGPVSRSLVLGKAWRTVWPSSVFLEQPWSKYRSATRVDHAEETLPTAWLD